MESEGLSESRRGYLEPVRSLVVKLGTQLLADRQGNLDLGFLAQVARQVAELRAAGVAVTIVSSGAVGCGIRELSLEKRPTDLAKLQATAAVGQRKLMDAWAGAFAPHQLPVAQLLLTRDDVEHRTRFLNLRNTIHAVQEMGAVPIINENDTISTDELIRITFGDNDILAAMVAHAIRAQLLVLLTVVDGVLDAQGQSIRMVSQIGDAKSVVRTEKSALGKGGMNSKVEAARMVTEAGECLVVANGRMENILLRVLKGEEVGTLFVPRGQRVSSRTRWIGSVRPVGVLTVDEGAVAAVGQNHKSLLAAGIKKVEGEFERGDVVGIAGLDGVVIGKGLTNYASADVGKIAGLKSAEVRALLLDAAYDEVIHKDNLVLG